MAGRGLRPPRPHAKPIALQQRAGGVDHDNPRLRVANEVYCGGRSHFLVNRVERVLSILSHHRVLPESASVKV